MDPKDDGRDEQDSVYHPVEPDKGLNGQGHRYIVDINEVYRQMHDKSSESLQQHIQTYNNSRSRLRRLLNRFGILEPDSVRASKMILEERLQKEKKTGKD